MVQVLGKTARDCDLIIDGEAIELKAHHSISPRNEMMIGFTQHSRADSFLFFAQDDERVDEVRQTVSNIEERELGDDWVLIYIEMKKE